MPEKPSYLIIGATGGIGNELARRLTAKGAQLMLCGRDPERLALLGSELGAHTSPVDAASFDQVDACVAEASAAFGKLDGIVNLAGCGYFGTTLQAAGYRRR